jgi:hypothetical protein
MQYRLRGHAALQTQQQSILAQEHTKNHTTSGSSWVRINDSGYLKTAITSQFASELLSPVRDAPTGPPATAVEMSILRGAKFSDQS